MGEIPIVVLFKSKGWRGKSIWIEADRPRITNLKQGLFRARSKAKHKEIVVNQDEVTKRIDLALREQGFIFYCSEPLWRAYTQGLLKSRWVSKYLNAVPEKAQEKFKQFIIGQKVVKGKVVEEAASLPEPTFTSKADWNRTIIHCGLKGVGAGKTTKSRRYCSLLTHPDGSISELVKLPINLVKGVHPDLPPDKKHDMRWSVDEKIKEIFQPDPYKYRYSQDCLICYVIIQIDFFSTERVAKLRRRVEDQLRKGAPADVIRMAKSLKVKDYASTT
jgi:hypothetical protein